MALDDLSRIGRVDCGKWEGMGRASKLLTIILHCRQLFSRQYMRFMALNSVLFFCAGGGWDHAKFFLPTRCKKYIPIAFDSKQVSAAWRDLYFEILNRFESPGRNQNRYESAFYWSSKSLTTRPLS